MSGPESGTGAVLPADGHVHSEWSWDAYVGSMERTCARAVELGLPAVAFTEHVDFTPWPLQAEELEEEHRFLLDFVNPDGLLVPPRFDADGYLESVQRCRELFPSLRIITGIEFGEPHRHRAEVTRLLAGGAFERVLGSLHCLPIGAGFAEPPHHFQRRQPAEVMRDYLAEIACLVAGSDVFSVLAHVDYAVRYWPEQAGPFEPHLFEDEFRHALRALAGGGRVLEVNTGGRLHPEIVRWWREEGGEAVTFGSDAHSPRALARDFAQAVAMVEAHGFRPGRHPYDTWFRPGR
ncbi:hypothetical protein CS0771_76690 [Catellatospora sp. IY07-71]|uniref:PHP domain-containing protein n=1 Tax=Catellatospora sp. IY07-71 TaxID=2728827 RepID=UPI001BB3F144|nr:PHP domain-containing protein [Catellatospora sp. IY07-71]BCJ78125.1 hypothetical protein CS0771_76690 [Catellatospora sp. IY07-71]